MLPEDAVAALPAWEPGAARLLSLARRRIRLVAAATPLHWSARLHELRRRWQRGERKAPAFQYPPQPRVDELIGPLIRAAQQLEGVGPLGEIYARRARELELEARLCLAVGTDRFAALAQRRYAPRDGFDAEADALCDRWLEQPPPPAVPPEQMVVSDDERHPESLVNAMRTAVGAAKLPFRVQLSEQLAALAAIGSAVVYVAHGQSLSTTAVRRTVLHEIHGHAWPQNRARSAWLGIFSAATARGSDDQEGRALWLEQTAGLLDAYRQRELALRHLAARLVRRGACFVDTVAALAQYDLPLRERLRIAARAHRGGGLARESVYLPALLRFAAAHRRDAGVDAVLATGQVALNEAAELARWTDWRLSGSSLEEIRG